MVSPLVDYRLLRRTSGKKSWVSWVFLRSSEIVRPGDFDADDLMRHESGNRSVRVI